MSWVLDGVRFFGRILEAISKLSDAHVRPFSHWAEGPTVCLAQPVATVLDSVNRQVKILSQYHGGQPPGPRDFFRHRECSMGIDNSKLSDAWRNGARLCGDATSQGISKAECVNDAQERLGN